MLEEQAAQRKGEKFEDEREREMFWWEWRGRLIALSDWLIASEVVDGFQGNIPRLRGLVFDSGGRSETSGQTNKFAQPTKAETSSPF